MHLKNYRTVSHRCGGSICSILSLVICKWREKKIRKEKKEDLGYIVLFDLFQVLISGAFFFYNYISKAFLIIVFCYIALVLIFFLIDRKEKYTMAVYYKFKSARDYDSIPMDGPFISVGTLKEKIFESKHLGRGTDFDLVVTNAQTNEGWF